MTVTRNLSVLAEEAGVLIGDLEKGENPVTVIGDREMSELLLRLRSAQSEALALRRTNGTVAIVELLEALGRIVQVYAAARNKYVGGPRANVDLANQMREIERLFDELQQFHRPGQ